MPTFLSDDVRQFLDAQSCAVVGTIDDRAGMLDVVAWFLRDGDEIVVNSAEGRRWPANLRKDPRISVVVMDGGRWLRLRGIATVIDDQAVAQADIAAMARKYDPTGGAEAIKMFQTQQRVSFRFRPDQVHAEI